MEILRSFPTATAALAAFVVGYGIANRSVENSRLLSPNALSQGIIDDSADDATTGSSPSKRRARIPLTLLQQVEFDRFDKNLNVTEVAQSLLSLTDQESKDLQQAARRLRDRVNAYEVEMVRYSERLNLHPSRVIFEIPPDEDLGKAIAGEFRISVKQTLGDERAALISVPLSVSSEEHRVYARLHDGSGRIKWSEG